MTTVRSDVSLRVHISDGHLTDVGAPRCSHYLTLMRPCSRTK